MTGEFYVRPYLQVPVRTPEGYLALSRALITAFNAQPISALRGRVTRISDRATVLQTFLVVPAKAADLRPEARASNVAADRAWGELFTRIIGWTKISDHAPAQASEAREVTARLFPEATTWLSLPWREQWAAGDARLKAMDNDPELSAAVDTLAGPPFVTAVRLAQDELGDALGITRERPPALDTLAIRGPITELRDAIVNYVQGVGGSVELDDEASTLRATALVAPFDVFRAAAAARTASSTAETDETPGVPIPTPD
jgi:hypothetical protein